VSKDLNEQFKSHLSKSNETLDIDFSIQVLSSGSWPFQQSFTFGLPTEVKRVATVTSERPVFCSSSEVFIDLQIFTLASIQAGSSTGCTICRKGNCTRTASKIGEWSRIGCAT
jgi:hypothetical protein